MSSESSGVHCVSMSFLDSNSQQILNTINDRLNQLDHKLAFITEFLILKFSTPAPAATPHNLKRNIIDANDSGDIESKKCRVNCQRPIDLSVTSANCDLGDNNSDTSGSSTKEPHSPESATQQPSQSNQINTGDCSVKGEDDEAEHDPNDNDDDNIDEDLNVDAISESGLSTGADGSNSYQAGNSPLFSPSPQSSMPLTSLISSMNQDQAKTANQSGAFPEGAVRRAADKAARSFESTQPKVFAWQMFREAHNDQELKQVSIPLRTFSGEAAEDLLRRQLPKVQKVTQATLQYFGWMNLDPDAKLVKTKLILSHLKNNAKVRNWTLREGKNYREAAKSATLLSQASRRHLLQQHLQHQQLQLYQLQQLTGANNNIA